MRFNPLTVAVALVALGAIACEQPSADIAERAEAEGRPPTVVVVTVGLGPGGPWAKPDRAEAWQRARDADTVRFQGRQEFVIEFGQESPFPLNRYEGQQEGNRYIAEAQVRLDAPEGSYKYDLTIDGQTLDPEIVVKKDPSQPSP